MSRHTGIINLSGPVVPLEALRWQAIGNGPYEDSRLIATLRIGQVDLLLEAIEVVYEDGVQIAADPELAEDQLGLLGQLTGGDGPFQTETINGREYVLFAAPYCD